MSSDLWRSLKSWQAVPLLLAMAAFLIFYSFYTPNQPLMSPDSPGYLTFSAERSGGYPFFLSSLRGVVTQPSDYTIAQRLIYALSILALCLALLRCLDRPVLVWLCAIALFFNFEVNRYHFSILRDPLFLSVSALFFASALAHLQLGNLGSLATASLFVGVLIAIRPTGVAFIPTLVVAAFCAARPDRRTFVRTFLAVLVPLIAVMSLEWSYYRAHHAGPRQSLVPVHILAKAGLTEAAGALSALGAAPPDARPLMEALEVSLAPVRALIAGAPSEAARCQLLVSYEVFVQYQFAPEQRRLATAAQGNSALVSIGVERLKGDIAGYLRNSLDHLFCMWTLGAFTEQERTSLQVYLQAHRPLPFEREVILAMANNRLPPAALLVRWTMLGIAALVAITALALVVALLRGRRPSVTLCIGGLCGMTAHAAFLLTALTGVGIPRYVLGLWIPLALGAILSVAWLWEICIRRSHEPVR